MSTLLEGEFGKYPDEATKLSEEAFERWGKPTDFDIVTFGHAVIHADLAASQHTVLELPISEAIIVPELPATPDVA
jgi:hypothetical protein